MESVLKKLTKRRRQTFYKHIGVHFVTNTGGESSSSISIWSVANQLGEHDFCCGYIFL